MSSFEQRMQTACGDGTIAGAVVVATDTAGAFTYQNAFEKSDIPYELDSPFKRMSCTKLIVSICALQCVDNGLITLDESLHTHLPTMGDRVLIACEDGAEPVFEELKSPVTLRLLLTHSAGTISSLFHPALKAYAAHAGKPMGVRNGPTIDSRYSIPSGFQPGSAWEYGAGHDWAGKLVEVLTGQDLDSYIKNNISPRLGLTSMTFWPQKSGALAKIPQTVMREGTDAFKGMMTGKYDPTAKLMLQSHTAWDDLDAKRDCFGGGGLTSSAPDYLKVLHSLLANDGKLLQPATVDRMFTPTLTPAAKESLRTKWPVFQGVAPGEYAEDVEVDWGLGAMIVLDSKPGWRSKGTLTWSGLVNLFWFIDRERDLCGIFATQLLPTGDDPTKKIITMWEKEMHRLAADAHQRSG